MRFGVFVDVWNYIVTLLTKSWHPGFQKVSYLCHFEKMYMNTLFSALILFLNRVVFFILFMNTPTTLKFFKPEVSSLINLKVMTISMPSFLTCTHMYTI